VADKLDTLNEIWVFIEQARQEINVSSWELLGEARRLAGDIKAKVAGVLLGSGVESLQEEIFNRGADKLYMIDDEILKDYRTQTYASGLFEIAKKYMPEIILMGATVTGRDLASAVATHLQTGLTADCTQLEIEAETRLLKQTRPAWGGNVMATILCKDHRPQMATVRPRVFEEPIPSNGSKGELIKESISMKEADVKTKIIDYLPSKQEDVVELENADVIVAGGRGLASQRNFDMLSQLAEMLGGEVGASRPVIEMGWMPFPHQVGQTGKTVRPKLYFAAGISGAVQHLAGMQHSNVIVAINKDKDAAIFNVATYGIVGDLFELLPEIIKAVSEYKSTKK